MTTDDADDVRELRRTLRDVIALSTIPSVWARFEPRQICDDLVVLIERMVDADAVCLLAPAHARDAILRTRQPIDAEAENRLRRAAAGESVDGNGSDLRLLTCSLGLDSTDRLVVAARRPGFPNERERLLVRMTANEASLWLDWKRAESKLASESAFRQAIENSMLAGVAAVDETGRQTYVNRAFAAIVGWDVADLLGKSPPFVYWAPEDHANISAALQEVLSGRPDPAGYELIFRRRDESRFDAHVLIAPIASAEGPAGFVASVYDITERKASERRAGFLADASDILTRSLDFEETLRAISALVVPRLADWCFIDLMESGGGFRRISAAFPHPKDEPLARSLERSYAPKSAPVGISHTFQAGRTSVMNGVTDDVLVSVARDQAHLEALRQIGIRAFISVPMTSRGITFGVISFIGSERWHRFEERDVALAEELARRAALAVDNARLYRTAQEANRAKDEFLANLSHELRTPMTSIIGWAHLLQLGQLDSEQMKIGLATIRQSGEAQARLIEELLDVSRIITGKLQLNPAPLVLPDVVSAAVAAIRPAAAAKRQTLELKIHSEDAVIGDSARLQQVFWNLLSNAVKFTPPGGKVSVKVERTPPANVTVTVTDDGEGIPAEFLPLVFERFRQAAPEQRPRAGLGLGLSIAKELVEMHGGSIRVRSDGPGRGSAFTVTLPRHLARVEEGEAKQPDDPRRDRLRAIRILLVEDDDATRNLFVTILRNFGADVSDASSVETAAAMLEACDPHVLVTDIEMPGSDGISLLHKVRVEGRRFLPAIAVTAYADATTRARVLAAGFDGFVTKPLEPMALSDEIARVLAAGRQPAGAA